MVQNIEECVKTGMYDIGLKGSGVISDIVITNIEHTDPTEIQTAFKDLEEKIAFYGVITKQHYLIDSALGNIANIMWAVVFKRRWDAKVLLSAGFQSVKNVTPLVLTITDESGLEATSSIQYSMGSFYDITKKTAIALLLARFAEDILQEKDIEKKKKLCQEFTSIIENFWRFFRDVGQMAGNAGSFLQHFINMSIEQISRAIVFLLADNELQEFSEKLANALTWHLSVFWWSYHEVKSIRIPQIDRDSDLLAEVGMQCIKLEKFDPYIIEIPRKCASFIKTLAEQFLEKGEDQYGFDPPRILEKSFYVAILAIKYNMNYISKEIDSFIVEFQNKYVKKYPDNTDRIIKELDDLENQHGRRDVSLRARDRLLKEVSREDISSYAAHVKELINIS
jgi:hypothetical protein